MIGHKNINPRRFRRRIGAEAFHLNQYNGAAAGLDALQNLNGTPIKFDQVSSFSYSGPLFNGANNAIAAVDGQTPTEFDPNYDIGVRVIWYVEGTVAITDVAQWRVRYKQIDINEALTVGTDTALNTVIASQSPDATTTLLTYRTSRGQINANTFDANAQDGLFVWTVDLATYTGFSSGEVHFLFLELDYVRILARAPGESLDAHTVELAAT